LAASWVRTSACIGAISVVRAPQWQLRPTIDRGWLDMVGHDWAALRYLGICYYMYLEYCAQVELFSARGTCKRIFNFTVALHWALS
jgi:hypothetical protein